MPFPNPFRASAAPAASAIATKPRQPENQFGLTDRSGSYPSVSTDGLPAAAAERLATIQAEAAADVDIWSGLNRLHVERDEAKADLQRYQQKHGDAADANEIARLQHEITKAEAAITKYRKKTEPIASAARAWQATAQGVSRFISGHVGHNFKAVPVKLSGDVSVDALQARVRELDAEIAEAESAPPPKSEAIQKALAEVAQLAERGAPRAEIVQDVNASLRRDYWTSRVKVFWPQARVDAAPLHANQAELPMTIDAAALMAWANYDQIVEKLEADIEAAYEMYEGPALTAAERTERLHDLRKQKLATERELAETIWAAIGRGEDVTFPDGLAPEAVLGVAA